MEDEFMLSLCLYREARGEVNEGRVAIANVIVNRTKKNKTSIYDEVVKAKQFSSITYPGDSQLTVYAKKSDPIWIQCTNIAYAAVGNDLPDITNGSTLYYNPKSILTGQTILIEGVKYPFPKPWNLQRVEEYGFVGNHLFLREV